MKEEVKQKEEEYVLDNDCPTCGSSLKYNPKTKSWLCEFCRVNYTLEELKKHNNASSDKNNKSEKSSTSDLVTYKCGNCGAEIVADEQETATFCIYCRSTAILKGKLSGEFKPDMIIPFEVEKKRAETEFAKLSKGRLFVPKDFTSINNIEKIKGVYIPFWIYDLNVSGNMDFDAKKVRSWTSGDTRHIETSIYEVLRTASLDFDKVPVDGSTRFANDIMNTIEPFDYTKLEEYNHAYLSGFFAEKYDVDSKIAYTDAEKRSLKSAEDNILSTLSDYSSKTVKSKNLVPTLKEQKYVLLPVWMVNVKYGGKPYIFAMNGQTGKFIGDIPTDKKKVLIYTIITFIVSFAICFLVNYLLYKVGV